MPAPAPKTCLSEQETVETLLIFERVRKASVGIIHRQGVEFDLILEAEYGHSTQTGLTLVIPLPQPLRGGDC
ncbi:hypothetical protein STEG23_002451, partial [Scotinomys teguina]